MRFAEPLVRTRPMLVGFVAFAIVLVASHGRATPYNNYVLFADALLHGHLWIDWPGSYIDAVLFEGSRYIVNDPVPGLLLLPQVALQGTAANQTLLACVLAGVACGAAWVLFERLGLSLAATAWLVVFCLAGTDLLWGSALGDVWFIAQTSAVAFSLLMLCELAGRRRGWLVAVLFALAVGSRFTLIDAAPVVAYWLAFGFERRERTWRELWSGALAFVPFVVLWVAYNEVRWHVPWDSGHTIFYHQDASAGSLTGSPFSLANVPMQLRSFFEQPPTFRPTYPYVIPEMGGTALTWTSPALVLAFFARRPIALVISAWIATVLVAAPSLLYYVNGYAQFGMRHALDFEPFVLLLMALAAREGLRLWARVLIAWSALAGVWGTWFWFAFYRT